MAAKRTPASKEKTPTEKAAPGAAAPAVIDQATAPAANAVSDPAAPPASALAGQAPEASTAAAAPPLAVQEPGAPAAPAQSALDSPADAAGSDDAEPDPVLILGDDAARFFRRAFCDVGLERLRQVEVEGFTPARDDELTDYQLPRAAASYASNAAGIPRHKALLYWPFQPGTFKPAGRRSDYVKAAALLLAEVERIDRQAAAGT